MVVCCCVTDEDVVVVVGSTPLETPSVADWKTQSASLSVSCPLGNLCQDPSSLCVSVAFRVVSIVLPAASLRTMISHSLSNH